jgi:hypothetical protein
MLILDSVDVYLGKRTRQRLRHNGLMSVILHKFEYCTGILFLNTSYVSEFGEAILSRIHVLLRYENLDRHAGRDMWRNFLEKARTPKGAANIGSKRLESLVQVGLNGGQVRCLTNLLPKACRRLLFRLRMSWLWGIRLSHCRRQDRNSSPSYTVSMLSTAYITEGIRVQAKSRLPDDGMDIPNFGEASSIIDWVVVPSSRSDL